VTGGEPTGRARRPALQRVALALGGVALIGISLAGNAFVGRPFHLGPLALGGMGLGVVGLLAAFFLRRPGWLGLGTRASVAFLSLVIALLATEGISRVVGDDFCGGVPLEKRLPPWFVLPMETFGEGFKKHTGPLEWRGKPLFVNTEIQGVDPNPFEDEATVLITYDRDGFRNPEDLDDWDIAVSGDSFTELGYLPYEALTTTVLAQESGLRVKNVGVSGVSTLSEIAYLERYGIAPSTRQWVLAFFEGNDLSELEQEYGALELWRATGTASAPYEPDRTYFLEALYERLFGLLDPPGPQCFVQAYFPGPRGEVPMNGLVVPPARSSITPEQEAQFRAALGRFALLAEGHGLTPWLAFVPCKLRVHWEGLRFTDQAFERVQTWRPSDFPAYVRERCEEQRIRFVDLTEALVAGARASGELLYNASYDTHWNARGAEIAGKELARAMREAIGPIESAEKDQGR